MYPRIRDLREDTDMSQKDFADLVLEMSQTGYSKYETGENDIPTDVLIRLSVYYDTSADYILGLTDQKRAYPSSEKRRRKLLEYRDAIRRKQLARETSQK